jgi:transposase
MVTTARKGYTSDVSDEEWAFCAPYLTLMKEGSPQRCHSLMAANEQDRAQVGELAAALQAVTGQNVQVAFVDQCYTGEQSAQAAEQTGLNWKWSNITKPSVVLCCFLAVG